MMKRIPLLALAMLAMLGCQSSQDIRKDAQAFIDQYTAKFQQLYYAASKAEWQSNTMIIEGDSTNAIATRKANEALAAFTGSKENIKTIQAFLKSKNRLTPLQVRQLEAMLYIAANNPQTVPQLVKDRIKAETEQTEKLFGFDFKIDGRSVTPNEIDQILQTETSLEKRLKTWTASKEVGKALKEGLVKLRDLRNKTVQALNYPDYFTYQVSEYGMTTHEMLALTQQLIREIWPLSYISITRFSPRSSNDWTSDKPSNRPSIPPNLERVSVG